MWVMNVLIFLVLFCFVFWVALRKKRGQFFSFRNKSYRLSVNHRPNDATLAGLRSYFGVPFEHNTGKLRVGVGKRLVDIFHEGIALLHQW